MQKQICLHHTFLTTAQFSTEIRDEIKYYSLLTSNNILNVLFWMLANLILVLIIKVILTHQINSNCTEKHNIGSENASSLSSKIKNLTCSKITFVV